MKALSENVVADWLSKNPAWQRKDKGIEREWKFVDFTEAMSFVIVVAREAETADHHPDILVQYNKVRLTLWTHDADGLTGKDFRLAARCDVVGET
jgi:4a-hydroxytetrahydrobiopterin dehydratase